MTLTPSTWNSLEIVKLFASLLTPAALTVLGIFIQRAGRRYEDRRWVNQKIIEKRLEIYDQLAPSLNDILCYFTFIGCWKEFDPPEMIKRKRVIDRQMHLAKPLFPESFFVSCQALMRECFTAFGGPWGSDSQLKTTQEGRKQAHPKPWDDLWSTHFNAEHADPARVQLLSKAIMKEFTASFGQLDFTPSEYLRELPRDVREDAMR